MEIAKLALEFVKALAWPVTLAACAIGFRTHIRDLFGRVTALRTPAGDAEFAAAENEVVFATEAVRIEQAEAVAEIEQGEVEASSTAEPVDEVWPPLLELVRDAPMTAVRGAWGVLVSRAYRAAEAVSPGSLLTLRESARPLRRTTVDQVVHCLGEHGLSYNATTLISGLKSMHHEANPRIGFSAAKEFVTGCSTAVAEIDALVAAAERPSA